MHVRVTQLTGSCYLEWLGHPTCVVKTVSPKDTKVEQYLIWWPLSLAPGSTLASHRSGNSSYCTWAILHGRPEGFLRHLGIGTCIAKGHCCSSGANFSSQDCIPKCYTPAVVHHVPRLDAGLGSRYTSFNPRFIVSSSGRDSIREQPPLIEICM